MPVSGSRSCLRMVVVAAGKAGMASWPMRVANSFNGSACLRLKSRMVHSARRAILLSMMLIRPPSMT